MPNESLIQAETNLEFVEAAYASLLGRPPDPQGMRHYLERLHAGAPRTDIVDELLASREAQVHRRAGGPDADDIPTGSLTVATLLKTRDDFEFVKRAWLALTGQPPATAEAITALSELGREWSRLRLLHRLRRSGAGRAHQSSLPDVHMLDLSASQLADAAHCSLNDLLRVSDEAFVQLAYMRLFHREADPVGRTGYLALCRTGTPRQDILRQLIESEEGRRMGARLDGLEGAAIAEHEPALSALPTED